MRERGGSSGRSFLRPKMKLATQVVRGGEAILRPRRLLSPIVFSQVSCSHSFASLTPTSSHPSDIRGCRLFSSGNGDADADSTSETDTDRKVSKKTLDRETNHIPPPCAAWNLDCTTWQSVDRNNTLIAPADDDPDNYSRIAILEDHETDFKKLSLGRMNDATKDEIFARYQESPEEKWTVAKLATTYGISQPRTQAILLLKTWEQQERVAGRVTTEHDAFEASIHEAHLASVRKLSETAGIELNGEMFRETDTAPRGGPLGKFSILRDEDPTPPKPDQDAPAQRTERLHVERKAREAEQDATHLRVPRGRWTFVVKDTSQRAVK